MTRKSFFSPIGSLARNIKRMMVISALLYSGETMASESQYMVRIHKNFIKSVMDKNFQIILQHIEDKVERNVYLTEVNASIDELELKVVPKTREHLADK